MQYDTKILDRQVGRNAQLFAQSIGEMESAEVRYPYIRILISLIEKAHSDWSNSPEKETLISDLVVRLGGGVLDKDEVAAVVRHRDG